MAGGLRARSVLRLPWAVACAVACAMPAAATTFVRMDAPQLAARSDVAVIATVAATAALALENGGAVTRVVLTPEQVVFGTLPPGPLILDEPGGRAGRVVERIFGAPEYRPGERVLAFLERTAGGTLRTTGMAMGKYALAADNGATRRFDGVLLVEPDGSGPSPPPRRESLAQVLAGLPEKTPRRAAPRALAVRAPVPPIAPFTYLGDPSRWFEPDAGQSIRFLLDGRGAASLGREVALGVAVDALATWSSIEGTSLLLEDGLLDAPAPFAGCDGPNRVVFEDPFDEIDDPVDCRGVLGIGGYCYADERRTVDGIEYRRIRLGKATIANGWDGCPQWTACNLAQIVTHELGHAIGLGHSPDETATMSGTAHFDGRCAGLAADDIAGARAIYPAPDTPTPTATAPPPPTATITETPTSTRRATPTSSPAGGRGIRGRITYYGSGVPVPGARLSLRGAGAALAVTQGAGDYRVDDLAAGAWTIEPHKDADAGSGAITALDAALVLQASSGQRPLDAEHQVACDVTGNGSVSPLDAARILQIATGELKRLPAAELCGSDFVFFPRPNEAPNQERIEPALDATGCRAGALSYAPLAGQLAGQNFRAALIGDCSGNWQPADARGAEPLLAPAGTAVVVTPPRRVRGGRWRVGIGLRSPAAASALELELRFDASQLTPLHVRPVHLGAAALADFSVDPVGRLRIALASAVTLPNDGRPLVVVDFLAPRAAAITARNVRPWSALLDDRVVSVPH
jgi:hypothetical protein